MNLLFFRSHYLFRSLVLTSLVLLLLYNSFLAQDIEDKIIKVESSLVIVNATITDANGRPVDGLSKESFEIFENQEKQELAFFESQKTPFAAVILIDTSGSMEQRVSLARASAIRFLAGLRSNDFVAIYNFDSRVSLVQDFSNLRDLVPQVYDLKASGMTVLNDAIYKAALALKNRPEKRKAIIVLSDGADTRSGRSASKALNLALETNVTIYTVDMSGVNTGGRRRMQNQGVLKKFARKSGGQFIKTPGGVAMRKAFENIVKELGIQYTLGYYPSNTKKDGKWRKIELKTTVNSLKIRTREGYKAPKQ